jgi:hypothetical protein
MSWQIKQFTQQKQSILTGIYHTSLQHGTWAKDQCKCF